MVCTERIILDELRICYVTDIGNLAIFQSMEIGESMMLSGYTFYRITNDRFKYYYEIRENYEVVAVLKYGLYVDSMDNQTYVYYRVNNHILYDKDRLSRLLELPESLRMTFHNFTSIDLAYDSSHNIPSLIKRMMRDKSVTTIINSKAVKDRRVLLVGVSFDYCTSLNRLKYPSITIKQKKAVTRKDEGITVQCYDKKAEIVNHSNKYYIMDYYGNPKRLFRLEVRMNSRELKDYFSIKRIIPAIDIINDVERLRDIFFYHLSAVIRFSRGRKKILWEELLRCNARG